VRPSTVCGGLVGPDGVDHLNDSGLREPGTYRVSWPTASAATLPQGRYQWVVTAVASDGQRSAVNRGFSLNTTLGHLRPDPRALAVPRLKPRAVATAIVTRPATVLAWVETATGAPVANVATGRVGAGRLVLRWDGRNRARRPVYPGLYVLRLAANNAYGRVELTTRFRVTKAKLKVVPPKRRRKASLAMPNASALATRGFARAPSEPTGRQPLESHRGL
jgi:hypothetical protein